MLFLNQLTSAQQFERNIFLCRLLVPMYTTNYLSIHRASYVLILILIMFNYVSGLCVLFSDTSELQGWNMLRQSFAFLPFVAHSNPSSLPPQLLDLRTVMFSTMTTHSAPAATVFIVPYKAENKTLS